MVSQTALKLVVFVGKDLCLPAGCGKEKSGVGFAETHWTSSALSFMASSSVFTFVGFSGGFFFFFTALNSREKRRDKIFLSLGSVLDFGR